MLKTALLLAIVMPLSVITGGGVMVVDVHTDDLPRIIVPVPLALVQAAAYLVPGHVGRRHVEKEVRRGVPADAREWLPAVREAAYALREGPDAELIRVEDPRQHETVVIRLREDQLEIRVRDGRGAGREEVDVNIPLDAALDILDTLASDDPQLEDLIGAVSRISGTDLVRVRDGSDRVRIWIW